MATSTTLSRPGRPRVLEPPAGHELDPAGDQVGEDGRGVLDGEVAGLRRRRVGDHHRGDRAGGLLAQAVERLAGVRVGDVAGQEPQRGRSLLGELQERLDARAQPRLVLVGGGDRADHPLDQLVDEAVEQGDLELALRGEVLVDQRLRDAAAGGDVVERGLVEAALREDLERRVEDRRAPIGCRKPAPPDRSAPDA